MANQVLFKTNDETRQAWDKNYKTRNINMLIAVFGSFFINTSLKINCLYHKKYKKYFFLPTVSFYTF